MATAAEVIPIAKICQYLAADDSQSQSLLKGRFLRGQLSRWIYIVRQSVEWLNQISPNSFELTAQVNYLYWLCMPYVGKAKYILNQGGSGQIVNPATGVASSIEEVFYQSEVDGAGTPTLVTGQTSFIITDDFILNNSLQIIIDNSVIPFGVYADRMSYTVTYTNSDATVFIYNGSPNIGLQQYMVIQVRGLKFVTI